MNTTIQYQQLEIAVAYPPLDNALFSWADVTTDTISDRRKDLLRDKTKAVRDFFSWVCKPVDEVSPADIKTWQNQLEERNLAPATIYAMISWISSFFVWLLRSGEFQGWISSNPVDLARPKCPKPYRSDSTKSLNDDQIRDLIRVVKERADSGDAIGKRDYALLLFYILTGMRRAEVSGLIWGKVNMEKGLEITYRQKGGDIVTREIIEPMVKDALLDYLTYSGRLDNMSSDSPLWTRHDRAGKPGGKLSTHSISKAMKKYAKLAGIDQFNLHKFRHSHARILGDITGSIRIVQDELGHSSVSVTRIYLERLGIKKDRFSSAIAERIL